MNSDKDNNLEDDNLAMAARSGIGLPSGSTDNTIMKRAAAKLIERYYYQLKDGCGNGSCTNVNCASSGKVPSLSPDKAAARALKMFSDKAELCSPNPAKMRRSNDGAGGSANGSDDKLTSTVNRSIEMCSGLMDGDSLKMVPRSLKISATNKEVDSDVHMADPICQSSSCIKEKPLKMFLTEQMLIDVIDKCAQQDSYSLLVKTIGQIYSDVESLNQSFHLTKKNPVDKETMLKEELREIEGDKDKDEDSMDVNECDADAVTKNDKIVPKFDDFTVDIESLRRAYKRLFEIPNQPFHSSLVNALLILCETAMIDLKYHNRYDRDPNYLNMFVIVSEIPCLQSDDFLEMVVPVFCKAVTHLPVVAQAKLARLWAKNWGAKRVKSMIEVLHQLITIKVYTERFTRDYYINDEESIVSATKVLKILFYACICGGEMDRESIVVDDDDHESLSTATSDNQFDDLLQSAILGRESKDHDSSSKQIKDDPLAMELGVKVMNCRKPLIDFEEFYHEPLSDQLEMDRDFAYYKTDSEAKNSATSNSKISFMNYPFILTPATKALGLYYDNRTRMFSERRISMLQSIVRGAPSSPFLKLKVRRDHIIDDALVELEMVAMENPNDLKKQLVVEFEGEQGIDEGGVSKEFFQLVVDEVFNPDFGMFTFNSEVQLYWFNPTSFESDAQFTLIGIVLGLAIYNNVILDVHFPMVVYRKLLGTKGSFHDLKELNPHLYQGLNELIRYINDDIEDVFMQTFRVGYQDVFGTNLTHDLKEGGADILVNQSNKLEFVDLYADFLLNKSIKKQFDAFKRGFQMVTDESPLKILFRPEEVELLVCGSKNFNFLDLEEATEYDGGYTTQSSVIRYFWEIVHEFNEEQKRKLLQFCTGSDRVPVGGLSKLKLIIARHGPDSTRLPTAHTCFNVLLLPEYDTKEKLNTALLKAIMYSKGFGML